MNFIGYVLILFSLLGITWLLIIKRGFTQNWKPEDLKSGRIVLVEKNLFTQWPFPVVGRPDQVYRLPDGTHIPVENKNRDSYRIYDTDIAQLSLQAWLMRRNSLPTAGHGYVVINNRKTGKRKALRVELLDDQNCEQMISRYILVISGKDTPRKNKGRKCRTCGHLAVCNLL